MSQQEFDEIKALYGTGTTAPDVAQRFQLSVHTVRGIWSGRIRGPVHVRNRVRSALTTVRRQQLLAWPVIQPARETLRCE